MKTCFIDWTEKNVNVYLYEKRGIHCDLIDSSSMSLDDELKPEILDSLPNRGSEIIYLSIPLNLLTLREQHYPFADRDKIKATIPYELEGILLGSITDYSIDHVVIESLDRGSEVLAVCLEKKKLQEIIQMFSSAGLDPKVVTSLDLRLSSGNIARLLEETVSEKDIRAEAARGEILNPSINLRQDELAYTGDIEKLKKNIRISAVLALIFLLLTGTSASLKLFTAKKEQKSLTGALHSMYHRVFPEDKKIIDVERQFTGNTTRLKKKKAALGGIPVLDILRDIANHNNSMVILREFNADGKNLILKGVARSFEEVESLKDRLTAIFNSVKVMDSGATADKKINFTIIMQEKTV